VFAKLYECLMHLDILANSLQFTNKICVLVIQQDLREPSYDPFGERSRYSSAANGTSFAPQSLAQTMWNVSLLPIAAAAAAASTTTAQTSNTSRRHNGNSKQK
jgi:hypothetical protein